MFVVVVSNRNGDKEYKHTQRKIALRQFEQYKKYADTNFVSLVHSTRKNDDVIAHWERGHA